MKRREAPRLAGSATWRHNPLLQGDCFGRKSAALATTCMLLCDALGARLQSGEEEMVNEEQVKRF